MSLKIMGAGFERTGTLSTYTALNALGYPCYHMFKVDQVWDALCRFLGEELPEGEFPNVNDHGEIKKYYYRYYQRDLCVYWN